MSQLYDRSDWPRRLRHAVLALFAYASVEVACACAHRPERAYDNARVFGAQRATTNVEEVLAVDSVPAVLVIGPPQMHFELGTAALEAGKHLFIEKPPAQP